MIDSGVWLASKGRVILVGAGPGDPDLLTVRAHRVITTARVVAYDELVGPAILDLIPADAELIPVGRRKGTCPDAPPIHPLVLERALEGIDVVRLKGGDPMIFGRGGEEAQELAALRIPFEIVPGISAALGAAAATGIPLTHRDAAQSVAFVTAHVKDDSPDVLAERAPKTGTVVLYMGLATLRTTAARLVEGGRPSTTPVAVVAHATLPTQRVVVADLATIADAVEAAALPAPALVIVGDVVARRVAPAERGENGPAVAERTATSPRARAPVARSTRTGEQ